MKERERSLLPTSSFPSEFLSVDLTRSFISIETIIEQVSSNRGGVLYFDPIIMDRLSLYTHQAMILVLLNLKPFLVLKDEEKYGEIMYDYGVKRMMEMENRYVRMVEGAKENESLLARDLKTKNSNLMDALFETVDRFLLGELSVYAKNAVLRERIYLSEKIGKLHDYLETFFQITDNSMNMLTLSRHIYRIFEYLNAEIIELTLNAVNNSICTLECMTAAIHTDPELVGTFHFRCIGYFSPLCLDLSDLSEFSIDGLMPSINLQSVESNEPSQQEEEQLESSTKKRKLDPEWFLMRSIPFELHEELVKHFDTLETILRMRLVCKYWNYLIVKNPSIWKYLTYYTLKNNPLFHQYSMIANEILANDSYFFSAYGHKIVRKETNWFDIFKIRFYHYLKIANFILNKPYSLEFKEVADLAKPIMKETFHFCLIYNTFSTFSYRIFHRIFKLDEKEGYTLSCFIDCRTLSGLLTSYLFPSTGGIAFYSNYDYTECLVEYYEEMPTSKFEITPKMIETCCFSFDFPNRINHIVEYLPDEKNLFTILSDNISSDNAFIGCPITKPLLEKGCSKENDILLLVHLDGKSMLNYVISKKALQQREYNQCRLYHIKYSNQQLLEEVIDPDYCER
ncbi:hypothetical protein NAEGRDRAFT_51545 [Naegleria gruberi]|uniref:F-box domain-containing protein n=1 Tax=Naegleria gruberi TaxID=5762 RepID=D2VQY0_NAEGR|nr:uncharacterized protein NAEGRDRAFT_51545 [Naegleria gruberi]EFC40790.1 hypothetical protein NAEGRDRAFT_51545 [Naegleria gruberi]|eukprot:XP_002673534.1 hypothetical protein NAEGRDRAFT_51545 [Naegleria gruberi strain NEG-M]